MVLWKACSLGLITDDEIMQSSCKRVRRDVNVFDAQRTMHCRCSRWSGGDLLDDRIRRLSCGRSC